MIAPERILKTAQGPLRLGGRVRLMGIVNATPDSFSDNGQWQTLKERAALAEQLLADGADLIDIGGESGVTNRPAVDVEEEIERVVPLIREVASGLGATVSIDTYKPQVARAAIEAGAAIVNDVSALYYPELADVCAETGAALVLMHTRAKPKQKLRDPELDGRVATDVRELLSTRIELALGKGVDREQLMLDPGPDFAKTPAQTIEIMRRVGDLHEFERPILLAISRKDFIGAITQRRPRERLAGTLAALGNGADQGAHMVRIHDVAAAKDFLAVRDVLNSSAPVDPDLKVGDELRWEKQLPS
jgi:dihydropteroate synthase